jgi:hypothetical protein
MSDMPERRRWLGRYISTLVAAAALAGALPERAGAAEFVLVNVSGVMIEQLYLSPCGKQHWGPNQLSGAPVRSSRAYAVSDIEPGCYDIMVVLPPWNECIMAGAWLARGRSLAWTISKSTVTQAIFGDCGQLPNVVVGGRRPYVPPER